MPTSRHRKKHKHQQLPHPANTKRKGGAASIMAIAGAIVGMAITYLASNANLIWVIIITVIGAFIGYSVGKTIDKAAQKGK